MTPPQPDLSRLTINRDPPTPGMRRALFRTLAIGAVAVALIAVAVTVVRRQAVATVQVMVATAAGGGSGGGAAAGVVANGYVVARTSSMYACPWCPGRRSQISQ